MAMSALSSVLPQVLPLPFGSTQKNTKRLILLEDKATVRSFQCATCACSSRIHSHFSTSPSVERHRSVEVRATEPTQQPSAAPINSILCKQCEGNGAIVCSQCKGDGINKQDFFDGHFKAGTICWLCRGKKETICGECNGAGFIGGFLSSFED